MCNLNNLLQFHHGAQLEAQILVMHWREQKQTGSINFLKKFAQKYASKNKKIFRRVTKKILKKFS